jgi:hypothetical protein
VGRDSVEPLLEVASFQIQVSSSRAAPGEGTRAYNVAGCRLRAPTRRITSRVLSPQGGTRTRSPPNAQPSHVYPSLRVRVGVRPSPNPPHPVWNLATGTPPLLPWLPSLLKTLFSPSASSVFSVVNPPACFPTATQRRGGFWVGSLQTPRRTTNAQGRHTVTGFHNNDSDEIDGR